VLRGKLAYCLVAFVLLASLAPLQRNIDNRRIEEKLVVQQEPAIRPGEAAVGLLLAGFRGLAANMLWFRATVLFQQGRVTEEIPLFQAISYLQPRFRAMWSFGAWHIAYNVSAHFYDRKDLTDDQVDEYRLRCFEIGEEFLRKGIKYNYYHFDLHWDLAFSILYYKQYKFLKEKGWPRQEEVLVSALKEMKIASLFQPPLAVHPAYVDRIMAIVMKEGGMFEDAYRIWYRLKRWPKEDENMGLVRRRMNRVVETIEKDDAKAYALELEKEGKLPEAYKVWHNLLAAAEEKKAQLAQNPWADPQEMEQTEQEAQSFRESLTRLEAPLKGMQTDVESLRESALREGMPAGLRERIASHFQSLNSQAEREFWDDKKETDRMYHELTRPAPKLDWWILLYVPLLLLAAGHLISGKETYAS